MTVIFCNTCREAPQQERTEPGNVPQQIRDQLLTEEDIKDGAMLIAQVIPTREEPLRLLISGDGPYSCSPTGNCDHWVFRQTSTGYEQEAELGSAQTVEIQEQPNKFFPDLLAQQHGSATFSSLRLYQYDGLRYRLVKCMSQDYADPSNPEKTLEKPIVDEVPCEVGPQQD
jgi:hypothetical protein